jgi:hypothetical protein
VKVSAAEALNKAVELAERNKKKYATKSCNPNVDGQKVCP